MGVLHYKLGRQAHGRPRLLFLRGLCCVLAALCLLGVLQLIAGSGAGLAQGQGCSPLQLAAAVAAAVSAQAPGGSLLAGWQRAPPNATLLQALLSQPSPLHGRQRKGGPPAGWAGLLEHMTNRNPGLHGLPSRMSPAVYQWFARAHTFNKSAGHSNVGLNAPVPACHFWVDHKYKVVMVRNTKTAGTSVAAALGQKEHPSICEANRAWCYEKCVGRQLCLQYLWDPRQVEQVFRDYTVFSFTRNPYARAISAWRHVGNRGVKEECQWGFERFAQLPGAYAAMCLANPDCCHQRFGWVLEHVEPQAPCLFDAEGRPAVDFLGRTEHLAEDMQALVDLINRRRPMGMELLKPVTLERLMVGDADLAGDAERGAAYARTYLDAPAALEDVRGYYAQDFARLRFPGGPESLQAALARAAGGDGGDDSSSSGGGGGEERLQGEEPVREDERPPDLAKLAEAAKEGKDRTAAVNLLKAAAARVASRQGGGDGGGGATPG